MAVTQGKVVTNLLYAPQLWGTARDAELEWMLCGSVRGRYPNTKGTFSA